MALEQTATRDVSDKGKPVEADSSRKLVADSQPATIKSSSKEDNALKTQTLVQDGKLPSMEVGPKPDKPKEWTVAVLLSSTGGGDDGHPQGYGAERKLDQMRMMAKETAGKSVNFMVSVERTVNNNGKLCHSGGKSAENIAKCDIDSVESERHPLSEHYFIHDGKIDKLPEPKVKNAEQDVSNLLKEAQQLSPSAKLGLVVQSVGYGTDGIRTNGGEVSLQKLTDSILKASPKSADGTRKKLDVLDLDACSMGEVKTIGALKGVADNIVASSAIERVTQTADGQNLRSAFQSLLDNPSQSGRDFASKLVDLAKSGENGKGTDNSTLTLAAMDTSKYDQFKQHLDSFGNELSKAMQNKDLKGEIRKAVDASPNAPTSDTQRDLRTFAQDIRDGAGAKDIALKKSAEDFLKSYDQMAFSQFGEKAQGQENIGGMSTYLPGKETLDKNEVGKKMSPLRTFGAELDGAELSKMALKKDIVESVRKNMDELAQFGDENSPQFKAIAADSRRIIEAKNETELRAAGKDLLKSVHDAENSQYGEKLAKMSSEEFPQVYANHHLHEKPKSITPGWDKFIKSEDTPY